MPEREHLESKEVSVLVEDLRNAGFASIGQVSYMLRSSSEAIKTYEERHRSHYADVGVVRISACIANDKFLENYLVKSYDNNEEMKTRERKDFERYKDLLK
jgi:predicted transcriptional regulator